MKFKKWLQRFEGHDLNGGHWTTDVADDQGLHRTQMLKPPKEVRYKNDKIDKKFKGENGLAPSWKKR